MTISASKASELSIQRYAGIVVALDEGHEISAVLEQEQVLLSLWDDIDASLKDRLTREQALFEEYCGHVSAAEDHLARTITPVDEDPAQYLALMRALSAGADLTSYELRTPDLSRLNRLWNKRFESEPDLRDKAAREAEELQAPAPISVEAAVLKLYPWSPIDEPDAVEHAPTGAAGGDNDPLSITIDPSMLPSAYAPTRAREVHEPRSTPMAISTERPAYESAAPTSTTPAGAPSRSALEPKRALGMTAGPASRPAGPATPFSGKRQAPPERAQLEPRADFGQTAPLSNKPSSAATPFENSPGASAAPPPKPRRSLEPNADFGQTAPISTQPTAAATPFSKGAAQPAAPPTNKPARRTLEPHLNFGQTAPIADKPKKRRTLEPSLSMSQTAPAKDKPKKRRALEPDFALGGTAAINPPKTKLPATPFSGKRAAPKRAPLEPNAMMGGTAPLKKRTSDSAATPFEDDSAAPDGDSSDTTS